VIDFQVTYGGFRAWLTERAATKKPRGIAGTCGSPYECPLAHYIGLFMPPEVVRVLAEGGSLRGMAYIEREGTIYKIETTLWEQKTPRWAHLFMQKVDLRGKGNHRITYKTALDCLNWAANDIARYYPKEDFS
jgi:hypothetical protein